MDEAPHRLLTSKRDKPVRVSPRPIQRKFIPGAPGPVTDLCYPEGIHLFHESVDVPSLGEVEMEVDDGELLGSGGAGREEQQTE